MNRSKFNEYDSEKLIYNIYEIHYNMKDFGVVITPAKYTKYV